MKAASSIVAADKRSVALRQELLQAEGELIDSTSQLFRFPVSAGSENALCRDGAEMQSELEVAKVLVPAAAALCGAFGGAGITAVLAFRRFRGERAFDRRAEWYERALEAVHENITALTQVAAAGKHRMSPEIQEQRIDAVIAAQPALTRAFAQAPMYATDRTVAAFCELMAAQLPALYPNLRDPDDRSKGFIWDVEDIDAAARFNLLLARQLTSEFRQHVGLDDLYQPSRWRWGKSVLRRFARRGLTRR